VKFRYFSSSALPAKLNDESAICPLVSNMHVSMLEVHIRINHRNLKTHKEFSRTEIKSTSVVNRKESKVI